MGLYTPGGKNIKREEESVYSAGVCGCVVCLCTYLCVYVYAHGYV